MEAGGDAPSLGRFLESQERSSGPAPNCILPAVVQESCDSEEAGARAVAPASASAAVDIVSLEHQAVLPASPAGGSAAAGAAALEAEGKGPTWPAATAAAAAAAAATVSATSATSCLESALPHAECTGSCDKGQLTQPPPVQANNRMRSASDGGHAVAISTV